MQRKTTRVRVALVLAACSSVASAGPVEVYRDGARFCPRDRAGATTLDEPRIVARARSLLPDDYCGPGTFVDGCNVIVEQATGSWRIYFQQYRLRDGRPEAGGLTHSYVVLDTAGNCYANIPGTEQGAPR
ncbi:MAG: hypothetical protein ABI533_08730 [Betaproteobacteria bacterium]